MKVSLVDVVDCFVLLCQFLIRPVWRKISIYGINLNFIIQKSKLRGNYRDDIKIMRRPKIKYARAQQNSNKSSCKKFLNPILKLLSGGFDLNRNIVAVSIFFDTAILPKKILRFDPTLCSNNSGLENFRIKTTTFLESPGRRLSYGISGYLLKIFAARRGAFAFA